MANSSAQVTRDPTALVLTAGSYIVANRSPYLVYIEEAAGAPGAASPSALVLYPAGSANDRIGVKVAAESIYVWTPDAPEGASVTLAIGVA